MPRIFFKKQNINLQGRVAAKKQWTRGCTGGPMVKNPPSNAGDVGSIPAWGTKIPCASRQLSLHAATTDPMPLVLLYQKDPSCSCEDSACHN